MLLRNGKRSREEFKQSRLTDEIRGLAVSSLLPLSCPDVGRSADHEDIADVSERDSDHPVYPRDPLADCVPPSDVPSSTIPSCQDFALRIQSREIQHLQKEVDDIKKEVVSFARFSSLIKR